MLETETLPMMDVDRLMDVAGVLRDLTREDHLMRDIPAFLASTLELQRVIIALVKRAGTAEPQLVLVASSAGPSSEDASAKIMMELFHQLGHAGFTGQNLASLGATTKVTLPDAPEQAILYQRQVDADNRLLVAVHPATISCSNAEVLPRVCNYLAREIRAMLLWEAGPEQLGDPFDRLTDREWVVLCGLNSDDGEKQLADRLGLSPHTLHSHIKSIYRKVGVQGRLPLLQKLNHAQCQYRMLILQPGGDPLRTRGVSNGTH